MTPLRSGSADRIKLGEQSTTGIGVRLGSNSPVDVIVPLGALEQHGPHLPLATDVIIAEAVADRSAERVGQCVVAPCMAYGASSHHLAFAGTSSLSDDVLARVQIEIVSTLLTHGFANAYLVTGHAGNVSAMARAADQLDGDTVVSFVDWPAQRQAVHRVASADLGLDPDVVGTHAGHFETSIMLLLRPDLVDLDRAVPGFIGSAGEASSVLQSQGMDALSSVGVIGDPRGATAEAGERYLAALVEHVVDGISEHRRTRDDWTRSRL